MFPLASGIQAPMSRVVFSLCVLSLLGCGDASNTDVASNGPPPAIGGGGADAASSEGAAPGSGGDDASAPGADGSAAGTDAGSFADASSTTDAAGDAAAGGYGPYGGDGPASVTTAMLQVPAPNGTFTTTAYIPGSQGAHPVVILSSGFFQTAAAYAPYAHRLASWGMLTLLRDDPNLAEQTPNIADDVAYTVTTWLSATNGDASSALHGQIDTTKIGLAGHSRGGQIALLAAEGGAHGLVRGVFGLDPVDTSMSGSPQARTQIASIGVPLAFIGETTDSSAQGCAPATDNYQVLYAAAVSPAVAITAIDADHTMFEDPTQCSFCSACTAGTANAAQVLAYAERYLTAFFARELEGDATVGPAFAGAGANQDVAAGLTQIVSK